MPTLISKVPIFTRDGELVGHICGPDMNRIHKGYSRVRRIENFIGQEFTELSTQKTSSHKKMPNYDNYKFISELAVLFITTF
uniref:Uncharacterized protein n=1 Tax=Acrobeloides nanus TaxID=290746 RepID=A0A914E5B4_9BILA